MLLEPSREAELGPSPPSHPPASHPASQPSHPDSSPQLPPDRSPSPKAPLNLQAASAGFSERVTPFPGRHGVGDRTRPTENEARLDMELEGVSTHSLTSNKDGSSSRTFNEAHDVAASLTPHCKTKFHMVNSGSLPLLFPPSHPGQAPPDPRGLPRPGCSPSPFPEWPPSTVQEGARPPATSPASPSALPHGPAAPPQTARRPLRAKSHESLHHWPGELVNGDSGDSELGTAKGHVRSLAEQFQRLQERASAGERERRVAPCPDQGAPAAPQESFRSLPSLGPRQPIAGSLGNGIWPVEDSAACLGAWEELSSADCLTAHNTASQSSGLHHEEPCSRGEPCAVDYDHHPGRRRHEGEAGQAAERDPAGFAASVSVDCWVDNVRRYYSSQQDCRMVPGKGPPASHPRAFGEDPMQKHPQWNQDTEQEISELESLFQASLQASQTSRSVLGQVDSSWRPLGKTGKTAASYLQLRLLKPALGAQALWSGRATLSWCCSDSR